MTRGIWGNIMGREHLFEFWWEKAFDRDEKQCEEKVKKAKNIFRNQPVQTMNKDPLETKT